MPRLHIAPRTKLILTIVISCGFFVAELTTGFYTHSVALIADAFHYLCDIISFVVALLAIIVSERARPCPPSNTYGWQRAQILGAFFNGVFLIALGLSILVQAIERFVDVQPIDRPLLVLVMGAIGLGLNVLVLSFLHVHSHSHSHGHGPSLYDQNKQVERVRASDHGHSDESSRKDFVDCAEQIVASAASSSNKADCPRARKLHRQHNHCRQSAQKPERHLGLVGVVTHVIGDAINNIGVIIAAAIIWKAEGHARYYADPAAGVFIAIMIMLTARNLTKNSANILLQIAPPGMNIDEVRNDLQRIPGVESVHELHIWRLDEVTSIATAHIVCEHGTREDIADKVQKIQECLHGYGVQSATVQTEKLDACDARTKGSTPKPGLTQQQSRPSDC